MFLLKFFFFIILFVVLVVVVLGAAFFLGIFGSLRRAMRQMKGRAGQDDGRQGHWQQRSSSTYGDEERVVDQRDPQQANRIIFTEEDGEYVDFVEEK